ncbi:hypothetical protein ACEWY4_011796 [Coilia grayii]|uniref:Uncharacterized protein n=1 Tax=Coilia grayii TaxID=363190 RepID=A0ABD1JZ80_9TELE
MKHCDHEFWYEALHMVFILFYCFTIYFTMLFYNRINYSVYVFVCTSHTANKMALVDKTTQSITTAKDMREATQTIMKPYANWEEYLAPAPLSIAILGELVYISSQTDFSINKNPPKDGYNHIRYPESFRACLMQVCNSGWWAFKEAHKSMDKIRLHTLTVPDYVANAVKILFQGNDEMLRDDLPDQLENIKRVAKECVECASCAEQKFEDVIKLTQELLQACTNSKRGYDQELKEITAALEDAKIKQQQLQDAKNMYEKALKRVETELDDAKVKYEKSMDSLPSGWGILAMDAVGGITENVTSLVNGVISLIARPIELACNASRKVKDARHYRADEDEADEFDKIEICSKSSDILAGINVIGAFIQQSSINWKELYDQEEEKAKTYFAEGQFKRVQNELKNLPNCKQKQHAEGICEAGISICEKLQKHAPKGECSPEETSKILGEWEKLNKLALAFDSESKNTTNSPSMTQTPPMMNNINNAEGSGKKSAGQRATEIAYFRIEQTRAQMEKARQSQEKCVEKMENNEKELAEVLSCMRKCNIEEIDFNTTIKILIKGMDAMGRVQAQWQKMIHFFEMVSHIVNLKSTSLLDFQTTTSKAQQQSYNTKLLKKDLIYKQAFQASNIANLVNMISETYTCMSDKHLMDRVSLLGTLMAMDSSKPEFRTEIDKLRLGCDEAQKSILQEVRKNKEAFDKSTAARLDRIERELLPILPAAAPEEIRVIKEAVQEGFTEDQMSALM